MPETFYLETADRERRPFIACHAWIAGAPVQFTGRLIAMEEHCATYERPDGGVVLVETDHERLVWIERNGEAIELPSIEPADRWVARWSGSAIDLDCLVASA